MKKLLNWQRLFFDQLVFKYTHGAIALAIINLIVKRRNLPGLKQIFGSKLNYSLLEENKSLISEIENELKNLEKIDLKFQSQEKRRIMQLLYDAGKTGHSGEVAPRFPVKIIILSLFTNFSIENL